MRTTSMIRLGACALLFTSCFGFAPAQAAEKAATASHRKAAAPAAPKIPAQPGIVWRGDHCTARIVEDLAKQYQASKLGKVEVQPFSTISGLDAVSAGTADVAGSVRSAMPDRAEEKGINFFPMGWDALVPITSSKNPVNDITLKQLHDVYLGRLTDWKDLGGAPGGINLVGVAGPLDGVEYSTRLLLFHDGDQAVFTPRVYMNTEKLEENIALDPHGLGMSTLSGVAGNPQIKMLTVEGVAATPATIADGSYPLYTALYFAARDDDKNSAAVQKFVQYADSDAGRAILRKHHIVPYAEATELSGKQDARAALVDERVHSMTLNIGDRPVAAPNATADYLTRTAPSSAQTQEAKAQAERINAEKAAQAEKNAKAAGDAKH